MKKSFRIWLVLVLVLLVGCLPTPEQEFVVNKNDNTVEKN